jgi:ABC-type multidrug transport system fused ATPase/permease subunit
MSLMRLVEPELSGEPRDYQPPITIDGIDCLRIGLKDLRSKIGIVPQNPVMFEGTLRSNLDPFDEYSDGDIWKALEGCGMVGIVRELGVGLMAEVTEYGENWSQGQRQLLCLGRALLRKCKVLLLDECTSSLDFETDREIQKTIRTAFAESTVLTIAHRISTILDSDKILVMDDGVAAEFSSPKALLQDPTSLFSDIVRHAEAEGKS